MTGKWRTLGLATTGLTVVFLVWFSFAPFTGALRSEFGLSLAEVGLLASAAVWGAPLGQMVTGWCSDRFGATTVFPAILAVLGAASVVSALATTYEAFFAARLVVSVAGTAFAVGIQHVSQWFPDEQLGTATGVYAGVGNAGAAGSGLVLPRAFGADWRAAFLAVGVAALAVAAAYYALGEDAPSGAGSPSAETGDGDADRGWFHAATRYGTVALALAYLASFGLELSLNGWLPTYFRDGFGQSATRAATLAAAFSLAAGLLRPVGGYASDLLARRGRDVLPVFAGRYREQWTFACLCAVSCALVALAAAGRTGALWPTVGAALLVGAACAFAEGAVFAQVPAMFPERSGTAAGVVGGVGTCGGIAFPLVLSGAARRFGFHDGYLAVAALTLPAIAVAAWVFRPAVAARANVAGLTGDPSSGYPEASDD
jgi:NNP family nitrate/nitrite transporter-like MFS transporter